MKNINLLLKSIRHLRKKKKTSVMNRLTVGLFVIGGLIIACLIGYATYKSFTSRFVAEFLPAEKTLAYLEMSDLSLPTKVKRHEAFKEIPGTQKLIDQFGTKDGKLPRWMSKNVGVALIQISTEVNQPIAFFRSGSRRAAWNYFNDLALEGETIEKTSENSFPIYTYPQGQQLYFTFAGPYTFAGTQENALLMIQKIQNEGSGNLLEDPSFTKAFANLPRSAWARGYANLKVFFGNASNVGSTFFAPLKQFADEISFTVRKAQNGLHINTFVGLGEDLLKLQEPGITSDAFSSNLSDYIYAENLALYLGGSNLEKEWQTTLKTVNELNPAYGLILEGVARAQAKRIFGSDISLEEDIYPLFAGEYGLTFSNLESGSVGLQLILSHNDIDKAKEKLERLSEGFSLLAAQFTPEVRIIVLPDGTEAKEYVVNDEKLKEVKEVYQDHKVRCIEVQDLVYGFCYTVTDELIVLSNLLEPVKRTLDATSSSDFSLSQYQPFRLTLSDLSKISDEMTFIHFENITPMLQKHPMAALATPYLKPFDAVTWVKHYFDDGISSEGFVLFK